MIFIAVAVGVLIISIALIFNPWTLLPTKSTPHTLSITLHTRFIGNRPTITLMHYVDGLHIADYVLVIENGLHIQEPQSYELPKMTTGTVEVNIDLGDRANSSLAVCYDEASELYNKGLLIYLTPNDSDYSIVDGVEIYDRYVYFVSGEKETCYLKESNAEKWSLISDPPSLKKFKRNEPAPHVVNYCGWKENKWIVNGNSNK